MKNLTKAQRVSIYKAAFEEFKQAIENHEHVGMCEHIKNAISNKDFNVSEDSTILTRKNFPEYFSFKPSTNYQKPECSYLSAYWWAPNASSGTAKRMEVFKHLIKGESKE